MTCLHDNRSALYTNPATREPVMDDNGQHVWICLDCHTCSDEPLAAPGAPSSPVPVPEGTPEVSDLQNGTDAFAGWATDWSHVTAYIARSDEPLVGDCPCGTEIALSAGKPTVADRLRALAAAEMAAAKGGSRVERTVARATARAYRLAAEIVEEEA